MINVNGELIQKESNVFTIGNRGFKYGDAIFETLKYVNGKVIFLEEHYFRLMSSLRMLRMDAPMHFTLEYFEEEILKTIEANKLETARIRFSLSRNDGGLYTPVDHGIQYCIETTALKDLAKEEFKVELYKDFYVYSGLMSTIKTNNKVLNVIASVFAKENDYDTCILINEKKQLVEAINGNLFLIKGNTVITPPITEGCLNGIIRDKLIDILTKNKMYQIEERVISPFELKKVDEVFITNSIVDIQPITNYRKKVYNTNISKQLKLLLKMSYS
ncbi:aminotransferase class IV [Urechidicola vernalis]|uniref:branched-chain-amino-acid transaminase n=1 Tax=Urechidicola vernalis TaxID=3075600 RepID=A0ABU2Y228_9FLAO|nr:aminotransferase class IV [Urechidicola sp. P050]MDT0552087.1 aminotransferase class IV [Urechidicola sp. P050]